MLIKEAKMNLHRLVMAAALLAVLGVGGAAAQDGDQPGVGQGVTALAGTGFTYQGELRSGGSPVDADCDFQFSLWDSVSAGAQLGSIQTVTGVSVADGRFTVTLNAGGQFGPSAFTGEARWLALAVQCPPDGGFTALTPRQALTPSPLALALPGLYTQQYITSTNLIGGHISNTVSAGVYGATIGGGGSTSSPNNVFANYGTVGGGLGNWAMGTVATVAGGSSNVASGAIATVAGGGGNFATGTAATVSGGDINAASGEYATVGGGQDNDASNDYATVGGGRENTASGYVAAVGGGQENTASGIDSTVGGGAFNTASAIRATIGGGASNIASGHSATIPGGVGNTASGQFSFAAGRNAQAIHDGAFVWADGNTSIISSTVAHQFVVRASGGVTMYTDSDATVGAALFPGSSSWSVVSDRNAKANFAPVDGIAILDALVGLPIETWNYNTQDAAIRHMGPMAQDFYAAFGLGETDTGISTVDADGVALAAIQGLYAVVQQKDAEIAALRDANAELLAAQAETDTRLAALESASVVTQRRGVTGMADMAQRAVSTPALPWFLLAGLGLLNVGGLAGYALARKGGKPQGVNAQHTGSQRE
jgi:hypothetical protein